MEVPEEFSEAYSPMSSTSVSSPSRAAPPSPVDTVGEEIFGEDEDNQTPKSTRMESENVGENAEMPTVQRVAWSSSELDPNDALTAKSCACVIL